MKVNKRSKKNFIKQVIARIDFPDPLPITENLPERLKKAALKYFPIPEPTNIIGKELELSSDAFAQREIFKGTQWNFYGKNREKKLTIDPTTLFVEYQTYQGFPKFKAEFLEILGCFFDQYSDLYVRRFGLRYINHIELAETKPLEWSQYIDQKLLHIFDSVGDLNKLSRTLQVADFNYSDFLMRFTFGMHNPDYPAIIKQKIFLLDYDAYLDTLQNFNDVTSNLERFHKEIRKFFRSSLKESLIDKVDWGKDG